MTIVLLSKASPCRVFHFCIRKFQKNIYFCYIDYAKAFDCVHHNKLWQILQEMGKPDHLTCLLRNLYAGQEATVRTGHGKTDWFQMEKGVRQGCILSPCLFNSYAEYIMRNAGMEEAQAVIKIAGRNINNLRYADQFSSVTNPVWLLATPWTTAQEASLSMTNSRSSLKSMSIKSVMPSNHLILCCPFLLLLSIFPSIRVFSNESALRIRWPKYWVSASTSVLPMNTQDWSPLGCKDLLAVQGTFKSLFQHHSSKASIFWHSDFFIVQLSHSYMTLEKP